MRKSRDVETLRDRYRDLALAWDDARGPRKANRVFRIHHKFYKEIRETVEGREAITGLLGDPHAAVRLLAATHSLRWATDRAVRALEDLENDSSLYGVDAKYTLQGHRNGKLDLDW